MSRFGYQLGKGRVIAAAAGTAATLGLLGAELAVAQGEPALEVDVADCVEIESPAERFRCYESRVDSALRGQSRSGGAAERNDAADAAASAPAERPGTARSAGEPQAGAPAAAAGASRAARDEPAGRAVAPASGRESPSPVVPEREIDVRGQAAVPDDFGLRRADDDDQEEEEARPPELFGVVAELRETVPNRRLITLENGQVWRQTAAKWYPLQPGYRVRIYESRWGDAYRMSSEELNGFIQVERVR